MKRILSILPLLLFALLVDASTTNVKINLWSGTQATGSWTGYQVISASTASQVSAGDQILVTVSSINGSNAMLMLNNGSWATLTGTSAVSLTTPTTVSIDVTEAMATEIKSNGFIVKGCNFTFTSVDLNHQLTTVDGAGKGNASTVLWSGSQKINWTADATGKTHSQKIDKSKFANAVAGMTLRIYYNNVGSGLYLPSGKYAKGVVTPKSGSTNLAGKNVYLTVGSSYTDLILTSDMVTSLQTNGLSIIGDYFTLTSVNLIDPNKAYSTFCQFNKDDIKAWEKGETPKLSMTITNLQNTAITVPYSVNLFPVMEDTTTHTFPLYKSYQTKVSLDAGETKTVDLSFSDLTAAGFYKMVALVDSSDVCTYNIGYDPTEIGCKNDAQADFWTYWDKAKAQLAAVPMNATLTELTDYSTSARKVYEVTLQSVPDVAGTTPMTIKGWYAEPTKAGKYPTLVQFQGTDGGKSTVTCPLKGDDNPGWVQFVLSTRGQMQCRDDKYGYDFYSYCWGDTAKHYYRNAYLDCARAVDFVKSRDCVNQKQIFATGGSQGGCFTYIAEALTQAFRAIAPSITGHADFQHGMEIVNWPRAKFMIAQKNLGWTDAQRDAFNSYYDTKNFTDRVTCPVISCFSLQDTTDPTHTNIAPYNLLTTKDKEYIINPFLGHATPSEWPTRYFAFFQKYIDADNASKPVQTVWTGSQKIDWSDKTGNYWQKVDASAFSGIKEGMKVRFNYTNLTLGAQGHICKASDWSNFDGDAAKYVSLSSSYFEFPVTAAMVMELKNNGCIVTGIGFTLTSVDLINTANIPNIACSVD